ncbi:manganese transport protein MntH [Polystyrenella longa]|uniref:Manganese transport protein MntH n=1 Tax=Polystyrenella longa TaxID=2528007 RepID=A0A518CSS2_9PLAN|nr:Nramp family divalent metal transporter [Polystyrenella longa]QDU82266.1 manganese transport protein MntH [Polystyrenella longa]
MSEPSPKKKLLARFGPGILVAATGVGAGDLAGGAIAGNKLGTSVLWAVLVGATLKFMLTEGLARWQLASGETLLEGAIKRFGRFTKPIFLVYLLVWSFFVGSALLNAIGVISATIAPITGLETTESKIVYGIVHSVVALLLVRRGGFQLFEKLMAVCIGLMFFVVMVITVLIHDDWFATLQGMVIPVIPTDHPEGLSWTVALIGGVGGTVTVLCYGYWIRESGEQSLDDLKSMRLDLGVGYVMTALFGMAMVIIGSHVESSATGTSLLLGLSDQLAGNPSLGSWSLVIKWLFLIGTWGAVFSSLLGVWQSVPYLFADFWNQSFARDKVTKITQELPTYKFYLYALATLPILGLFTKFEHAQKLYAVLGAFFVPMLAVILLLLLGSGRYLPGQGRNRRATNVALVLTLLFFLYLAAEQLAG